LLVSLFLRGKGVEVTGLKQEGQVSCSVSSFMSIIFPVILFSIPQVVSSLSASSLRQEREEAEERETLKPTRGPSRLRVFRR